MFIDLWLSSADTFLAGLTVRVGVVVLKPWALRGRFGEKEMWRRWSVSFGRDDELHSGLSESEVEDVEEIGGTVRRTERDRFAEGGGA